MFTFRQIIEMSMLPFTAGNCPLCRASYDRLGLHFTEIEKAYDGSRWHDLFIRVLLPTTNMLGFFLQLKAKVNRELLCYSGFAGCKSNRDHYQPQPPHSSSGLHLAALRAFHSIPRSFCTLLTGVPLGRTGQNPRPRADGGHRLPGWPHSQAPGGAKGAAGAAGAAARAAGAAWRRPKSRGVLEFLLFSWEVTTGTLQDAPCAKRVCEMLVIQLVCWVVVHVMPERAQASAPSDLSARK